MKKGDKATAQKFYLESIESDIRKDSSDYGKHESAKALGKLYLEQKNYATALYFFNASTTEYRIKFPKGALRCGTGALLEEMYLNGQKAICYNAIQKYDSVVLLLAEHMFSPQCAYFDNTECDDLAKLFANAVKKLYGEAEAREKLITALDSFCFDRRYDSSNQEFVFNCYFDYTERMYLMRDVRIKPNDTEWLPRLTKEYIMSILITTPSYCYIMQNAANSAADIQPFIVQQSKK